MEKLKINPQRLQWCCDTIGIAIDDLSQRVDIALQTLEKVMLNEAVLSIKQLEKIAHFFNRNLLFFLNPDEVKEEKVYSVQFRTINNQKTIHSVKLRAFIERIEQQRKTYIGLLEDLGETPNMDWFPEFPLSLQNIKKISADIRLWLGLRNQSTFEDLRQAVEQKGIMVFISNGYNGQWQISKQNPVRGFSLYYDVLPIIVIKKQESKGAQAFTLMHELAHLLLHKESMIDNDEDFFSYQGREKEANEFAGHLLIPDDFLNQIDSQKVSELDPQEIDHYLEPFKKSWSVSGEAILVRLLRSRKITQAIYADYKEFKQNQLTKSVTQSKTKIPRTYRNREPLNMFGKSFVCTVFDALHSKQITLAKASTHLDNIKISDVHKLEQYIA